MDSNKISLPRLFLKSFVLFSALNLLFALVNPMPAIGKVSLYNWLLPGRERLPYGDDPSRSYNLNLYSLEAMFASHKLTGAPKPVEEFRVLIIGDSSVWGFLLENEDTLTGALNRADLLSTDGREVVFYNLGHPTISLTKDLMILDYAMQYKPDLIIWPVTLESFPINKQTSSPIVQNNGELVRDLVARFNLTIDTHSSELAESDLLDRSLIGQRRNIADILRLQLYGFSWAATGVDVFIPEEIELRASDLEANEDYYGLLPPELPEDLLALDVLQAGVDMAGETPVLIVNEPIFVSQGANSDIRYNSFYPRWAYDEYRESMETESAARDWQYTDLWQAVSNGEFTNTPIHLTPQGTLEFAEAIIAELVNRFGFQP
jgi:hypothetical protein